MKARLITVAAGLVVGATCASLLAIPQIRGLEQSVGLRWLFLMRGPVEPPAVMAMVLMNQHAGAQLSLPREGEQFHRCEDLRIGAPPPTHMSLPAMPSRWPRCLHARLIAQLADAGVRLIVFDVLFRQRPPLPGSGVDLHALQDDTMAAAAAANRVVIAQKVEVSGGEEAFADLSPVIAHAALGSAPFPLVVESGRRVDRFMAFKVTGLVTPTLPAVALQAYAAKGYPFVADFLARHASESATLLPKTEQELLTRGQLQATLLLIRQLLSAEPSLVRRLREETLELRSHAMEHATAAEVQALTALYTGGGTRFLNLYGPAGTIPATAYNEVLAASLESNSSRFKDRVVFVGFAETLQTEQVEHFATAFSSDGRADLSGVEIAATAFSNLLRDETIRDLPLGYWVVATFLAAFLSLVVCKVLGNRVAFVALATAVGIYGGTALYLFGARQIWLPIVIPGLIAVPAGMLTAFAWKWWTAHQQRAHLRHVFSYFVPREVVSVLEKNAGQFAGAQESIECACVATDAANYTALAETMTPEKLTEFLNRYFEALFGRVADRGGFVSDVVGDAMLAIWPNRTGDTRRRVLHALIEMRDAAQEFNERLTGNRLMTRFGVDWGRVALTTVGAHAHYEYRAVGDAVNTATRIQELNKKLRTRILLSQATLGDAGDDFVLRDVGQFLLRGKSHAVHLYELLELRARSTQAHADLCVGLLEGIQALDRGDVSAARARFLDLQAAFPGDGPTEFYLNSMKSGFGRNEGAWIVD